MGQERLNDAFAKANAIVHPPVVVAVPVYKPEMTVYEAFSLRRCAQVLGRYPICFFGPDGMDMSAYTDAVPSAALERFPNECFASVRSYSDLLLTTAFYDRFSAYEFMLIYQLDAFVFYDALAEWCAKGYDYIGAPWRESARAGPKCLGGFGGVGNGGFSLRRPRRCYDLLARNNKENPLLWRASKRQEVSGLARRFRVEAATCAKLLGVRRHTVQSSLQGWYRGEDFWWGLDASRFEPSFTVAPAEEAVYFSFETDLEALGHYYEARLPFGCHAPWNVRVAYQYFVEGVRPSGAYNDVLCSILDRSEGDLNSRGRAHAIRT